MGLEGVAPNAVLQLKGESLERFETGVVGLNCYWQKIGRLGASCWIVGVGGKRKMSTMASPRLSNFSAQYISNRILFVYTRQKSHTQWNGMSLSSLRISAYLLTILTLATGCFI